MTKNKSNQQLAEKSVGGQALIMSLGTFSSRWLGLLRESLLAYFFDRSVTDAWITAFRIPNFFRRLLGEGSLSVSFIPVFADLRQHAPDPIQGQGPSLQVRNFINGFYTLLLLILSLLTLLGILYPEIFVSILLDAKSFSDVPGKFELTLRLTRIMFAFVFFISTFAYYMGILNALGRFGWAALAPLFFNIAMIISTLVPGAWFPMAGDGLAWGVVIGGALQSLVLIPQLLKLNYLPRWTWSIWSPEIARVFRNMVPGLFGMSLMQITLIVNTRFASSLGEGAISYIYWADRLLELPLSLISVSLGTALLPTLAKAWARDDRADYAKTGHFYLRLNLYLSLACSIGLYILARPIVEILFQRGLFTEKDSAIASQVLWVYAFAMIPTSGIRILGPFYYAVKNTWYPAVVSALGLVLHLSLAPLLMKHWGLFGLNASTLISASLNFTLLLTALPWLTTSFDMKKLALQLGKFFFCGLFLAVGLKSYFLMIQAGDPLAKKILALLVASLLGGGLFAAASRWIRLEEFDLTVGRMIKKVKTKIISLFALILVLNLAPPALPVAQAEDSNNSTTCTINRDCDQLGDIFLGLGIALGLAIGPHYYFDKVMHGKSEIGRINLGFGTSEAKNGGIQLYTQMGPGQPWVFGSAVDLNLFDQKSPARMLGTVGLGHLWSTDYDIQLLPEIDLAMTKYNGDSGIQWGPQAKAQFFFPASPRLRFFVSGALSSFSKQLRQYSAGGFYRSSMSSKDSSGWLGVELIYNEDEELERKFTVLSGFMKF